MEFDGGGRLERDGGGGRSERGGGGGRSERDSGGGSGSDELVVESDGGGGCNELVVESDGGGGGSGSDESGFGGSGGDEGVRVCCGGGLGFLGGGGPIEFVIAARRIEEKLQRQWCELFFYERKDPRYHSLQFSL